MGNELRLDGKVAVITGAGRGLGRTHALALAARGARVVVNDLDVAEDVAAEIRAGGGEAVADTSSVAEPGGAAQIVDTARRAFGPVDILVNNAGIGGSSYGVEGTPPEAFDEHLSVHLSGSFLLLQAAWGDLCGSGAGRVVNTTSGVGLLGFRRAVGYASAKAGIVGLTRTAAIDGAGFGVGVNAVAPIARTRMAGETFGDLTARLDPELVSAAVVWLCHPACDLSGEVLTVGGGRVARVVVGVTQGIYDAALTPEGIEARRAELLSDTAVVPVQDALAETDLIRRAVRAARP